MLGYKYAKSNGIHVIITLEISKDAITNMGRSSVVIKETAKYRTNKAKVLAIEDMRGNSYEIASPDIYKDNKSFTYKLNEIIEEPTYDMNPENVCTTGIHFYLMKYVAESYIPFNGNGIYRTWHNNGHKEQETHYRYGKRHGPCLTWYSNGQMHFKTHYVDGEEWSFYQEWYDNGQKHIECTLHDGKPHGPCKYWYSNGKIMCEYNFEKGLIHGLAIMYYDSGRLSSETIYNYGKKMVH